MERLWAPWRMKYVTSADAANASGCVLCDAARVRDDAERLILHRASHSMTMMNLYPYTNGHVMVVPYRHVSDLSDLTDEERLELMVGATHAVVVMRQVLRCEANNVGMNLGRAAGAGIDAHLHLHVVPRWAGDTNYMAVIGDTRVISEALEETYAKLRAAYVACGLVSLDDGARRQGDGEIR